MKILLSIDARNWYHNVRKKYDTRKVDYSKVWEYVKGIGDIVSAHIYGTVQKQSAYKIKPFINSLQTLGFTTHYINNDAPYITYHGQMITDILNSIALADTLILGTNNPDMIGFVNHIKEQGYKVIILGSRIPDKFDCEQIEIPESFLA